METKYMIESTNISDVDLSKVLNLDFPLFKCDKTKGCPGLALAWCLLNNKGVTSIASINTKNQNTVFVILETAFSDFPVANRGTFRTVATGYMKMDSVIEYTGKEQEEEQLKIDGLDKKIEGDEIAFSIHIYHNSSFCKAQNKSEKSGACYFDIYKDESCTVKGWNINPDFMKTLYSFLKKDDDELFENNQLFEEDNNITVKYNKTYSDEKERLKLRYKGYVKPIIKHLKEKNIGMNKHHINDYHNILVFGTPGVGKSHLVDNYMIPEIISENKQYKDASLKDISEYKDEDDKKDTLKIIQESFTERITFTSSTSYEDFFGCYKPISENTRSGIPFIKYQFVEGVFAKILKTAIQDMYNNYVLVIEEINRADVYDVFGQIFQLLDREKTQESSYGISLPVDTKIYFQGLTIDKNGKPLSIFEERFNKSKMYLPPNLFIVGTMNSADQGVRSLDTAFKRRFSMVYINVKQEIYCSSKIPLPKDFPTIEQNPKEGFKLACSPKVITKSDYVENYLKPINNSLLDDDFAEDKMISEHFIKVGEVVNDKGVKVEGIEEIEFIINIIGYLLQNVYKNSELPDYFKNKEDTQLFSVLKAYVNAQKDDETGKKDCDYKLENILDKAELNKLKVRKKDRKQTELT